MWRYGVDIGCDDVRLDLVAFDVLARARVVDRVEQCEQLAGLLAIAQRRKRKDCPHGGMAILPAIFAQARWIAPDVAGIERGLEIGRTSCRERVCQYV